MFKFDLLRFSGFNDEWSINKLDEISSLTSSKRIYSSDYVETGIPFYRGAEITQLKNNEEIKEKLFISTEKYNELKNKFGAPKKDDILVTGVGTLGNVYKIRDNAEFYFKDGNLIWIKDITINPDFLELYLETFKNEMLKLAIGSTQKALTIVSLEKLKVKYPNIQEQRKIANFFEVLDNKIRLLSEKYNYYIDFKKYLMQQIFAQKLRFANFTEEWKTVKIKDIFDERSEKGFSDLELLSVTLNDGVIKRSEIESKDNSNENKSNYKHVLPDDIVYNSMRMWQGASGVSSYEGIVSPAYTILIPKNAYSKFFGYYFKTNEMIHQFKKYSQGLTSDTWNLKYPLISEIKIKIPSIDEQKEITNVFETIDLKTKILQNNLEEVMTFKKGLLQQMFV